MRRMMASVRSMCGSMWKREYQRGTSQAGVLLEVMRSMTAEVQCPKRVRISGGSDFVEPKDMKRYSSSRRSPPSGERSKAHDSGVAATESGSDSSSSAASGEGLAGSGGRGGDDGGVSSECSVVGGEGGGASEHSAHWLRLL